MLLYQVAITSSHNKGFESEKNNKKVRNPHAFHMHLICISYAFDMHFICISYAFDMHFICGSYADYMRFQETHAFLKKMHAFLQNAYQTHIECI